MAARGSEFTKTMNEQQCKNENITPDIKPGVTSDHNQPEKRKVRIINNKGLNPPKSNISGKLTAPPQKNEPTMKKKVAVKNPTEKSGANVLTTKNGLKQVPPSRKVNTLKKLNEFSNEMTERPPAAASKKGSSGLRSEVNAPGKMLTRSMAAKLNNQKNESKKLADGEQSSLSKQPELNRSQQQSHKSIKPSAGPKKEIAKQAISGKPVQRRQVPAKIAVEVSKSTENPTNPTNISTNEENKVSSTNEPDSELVTNFPTPNAIDDTYITFNGKFANACNQLNSFVLKWIKVVEKDNSLPEDAQEDIRSALGKANLLLRSKLPQFGSLLYMYLCQNESHTAKILACDLDGWWEVATIQLKAITAEFDNLESSRQYRWRRKAYLNPITSPKIPPASGRSRKIPRRVSRNSSITSESCSKTSFCILGVRESMGSINKIGAVPVSAENVFNETK
ncbi:unnamed protein product [Orchesella dallaii]|uniref:Uncharacterized protein n=1 Tax=Orchesella dallaii TaxID=48710 RepID=A0ABP1PXD8_9HEXA